MTVYGDHFSLWLEIPNIDEGNRSHRLKTGEHDFMFASTGGSHDQFDGTTPWPKPSFPQEVSAARLEESWARRL
jgi:hypothetical protein